MGHVVVGFLMGAAALCAQSYTVTTVAGNGTSGFSGDNGAAVTGQLNAPFTLAVDSSLNLYIADQFNNRIRKVTAAGTMSTIAGNGTAGYAGDNAAATAAELNTPTCV